MESKTQQQKNKSNVERPYTIRFYIDYLAQNFQESRTDQSLDFTDPSYVQNMFNLVENIKKDKKDVPRVVEIQLRAHGNRDGIISFEKNTIQVMAICFIRSACSLKNC